MRRMHTFGRLAAIVAVFKVGSAGATGGLPDGSVSTTVEAHSSDNSSARPAFLKANVGADASAMKKITLNGKALVDDAVGFAQFRVVKTVASPCA